jgi:hypothetical protein
MEAASGGPHGFGGKLKSMRPRVAHVKPLAGFRLSLRFTDGAAGVVDLSDLAGQGVFSAWRDAGFWEQAAVDPATGTVSWPGGLDIDPDCLYRDITGAKTPGSPEADQTASA